MFRNERTLLLSFVGLLTMLNFVLLMQGGPTTANADEADSIDPVLGPAAGLTLTDTGEDGTEMTLKNKDGHLSWGDEPQQVTFSEGYVHIGALLTQLMDSEQFEEERVELQAEIKERGDEYNEKLEEIQQEWEESAEDEAVQEEIRRRGQQLYQEYQQFQQQVDALQQGLTADQLERAYRDLVSAVNVVADRLKIDTVYRFIPTEDEFTSVTIDAAMMEIRLRSLLRYPDECNITSDVIEELNLNQE